MTNVFRYILELSYSGSMTIWIILFLRKILEKTDKRYIYYLWALPWIKLIVPISSIGSWNTVKGPPQPFITTIYSTVEQAGIEAIRGGIQNLTTTVLWILCFIWMLGMLILTVNNAIKYRKLKKRLAASVKLRNGVYLSDGAVESFVLGVFRPKIYLPYDMNPDLRHYIILHEKMHIKRRDNLIKILMEIITIIHWFNPMVWIARHYMTEDMEMSCDEAVMGMLNLTDRKKYAVTLVQVSSKRDIIDLSVLSFGEDSVKKRVRNMARRKSHSKVVKLLMNCLLVIMIVFLMPLFAVDEKDTGSGYGVNHNEQFEKGEYFSPTYGCDGGY